MENFPRLSHAANNEPSFFRETNEDFGGLSNNNIWWLRKTQDTSIHGLNVRLIILLKLENCDHAPLHVSSSRRFFFLLKTLFLPQNSLKYLLSKFKIIWSYSVLSFKIIKNWQCFDFIQLWNFVRFLQFLKWKPVFSPQKFFNIFDKNC